MSLLSLTLGRSSLTKSDLVIGTNPFGTTMHIPENGITRPDMDYRRTYAPDSSYVPGKTLIAAVLEASFLPCVVYCHAATTTLLVAAEDELNEALGQWSYDVTLGLDGESWTWSGEPVLAAFGEVDSGMVAAHMGNDALYHWWEARSRSLVAEWEVDEDGLRFVTRCAAPGGMVVQVPIGINTETRRHGGGGEVRGPEDGIVVRVDGEEVAAGVREEFGQRWVWIAVPAGAQRVEVQGASVA